MGDFHEGDMALELSERELISVPPLELLNMVTQEGHTGSVAYDKVLEIARGMLDQQWLERAKREPDAVRKLYEETIGLDGFPGSEEGTKDAL